jgi:dTDP-4-dehydrorhamnose reductase
MRYLITGPTGLLGSAFIRRLGSEAIGISRKDLEIERFECLSKLVETHRPDAIINCAAHVNADEAEDNPEPAYEANVNLPGRLSRVCKDFSVPLVHFSSTGCYGSWKQTAYTEDDPVHPTTIHHRTKVMGEDAIRNVSSDHLILRIGWMFGGEAYRKKNFVWQRLLEAIKSEVLTSDQSQKGCPTNVDDVVEQTRRALERNIRGTFNCVTGGSATRFEYVSKIVELFDLPCQVVPGEAFKRRAPVSFNETAINQHFRSINLDEMPCWINSLIRYRDKIVTSPEWHALIRTKGI